MGNPEPPPLPIAPDLTEADLIVLKNLEHDIHVLSAGDGHAAEEEGKDSLAAEDESAIKLLDALSGEPTLFTTWDKHQLNETFYQLVCKPYVSWASRIVRTPADTVFLTLILFICVTIVPSALLLSYHYTWPHAILHHLLVLYCAGPFTLLMHNHIHNNGILARQYAGVDWVFPYLLGPLMGHTWDSYYWHHVKHHHVENNGPEDLSSTIRYQRDSPVDFLKYLGIFLALTWIELPRYFLRTGKYASASKAAGAEWASLVLICSAVLVYGKPAVSIFLLPLIQLRVALMVGNWGQHCLVDDVEPTSDFRSSITLIDVPSNRFCFNDGYHTSHHLNPRRHWRQHPASFLKAKAQYQNEGALTFRNIDYLMMTIRVLSKDYDRLARCLVPMGDQIKLTHQEKMNLLRRKTRKFSEQEIQEKFRKRNARLSKPPPSGMEIQ